MDPDALLDELRTAAKELAEELNDFENDPYERSPFSWTTMRRLVDGLGNLDQWLTDGGSLPGRWRPGDDSFVLTFSCDSAAFEGLGNIEIARILRHVHDEVLITEDEDGHVRDRNGNTVGTWRFHHG